MRLTVFEQSNLLVGDPAGRAEPSVSWEHAADLVALGERIGARIANWRGADTLRVHKLVGFARVGDLEVEILPKLDDGNDAHSIRHNFLGMLALTQDLQLTASESVGFRDSDEPFILILARLYCRRLLDASRRGLPQEYVLHREHGPRVRGRIEWAEQVKMQFRQKVEVACAFDDRSVDSVLNRTLKAALLNASRLLRSSRDAGGVTELRHAMSEVSDQVPNAEEIRRVRTDKINHHLGSLLTLAKLLIGRRSADLGRSADGHHDTFAIVWDMNVLFEEYIGRIAERTMGAQGESADLQRSAFLAVDAQTLRPAFRMRPDIIVSRGRIPRVVVDTKWKRLDDRDGEDGVSHADVYQMLAYAGQLGVRQAVLIYPHFAGLGPPGLRREFRVSFKSDSPTLVRVATVDLRNLDHVSEQVAAALGQTFVSEAASRS